MSWKNKIGFHNHTNQYFIVRIFSRNFRYIFLCIDMFLIESILIYNIHRNLLDLWRTYIVLNTWKDVCYLSPMFTQNQIQQLPNIWDQQYITCAFLPNSKSVNSIRTVNRNEQNEMVHNPLTSGRNRFVYCCTMKCAMVSSFTTTTENFVEKFQ